MMKKYIFILLIIITGCKVKFDPNAEWKAIDVIHAVLDLDKAEQYVIVNRAFQNKDDTDARDIAKINDSIYHTDNIKVRIDNLEDDFDPYYLEETILKRKDGVFAGPEYKAFTFDTSDFAIRRNEKYRIEVINEKTGKVSYATTKILGEIRITNPRTNTKSFTFIDSYGYKDATIKVFNKDDKEMVYQGVLDIVYITFTSDHDTVSVDTIEYTFANGERHIDRGRSSSLDNYHEFLVSGAAFFSLVRRNIEPIESGYRRFWVGKMKIIGFGPEMSYYIKAERSFNVLSQTKPIYSNVYDLETGEEELGIVTSRKEVQKNIFIGKMTIDSLKKRYPELRF